jgi:lipopolysaccharide export LptBFGC system permease protein LptF
MKKILFPLMMLFAIVIALYEQSKDNKNIYIMIVAIVIFFYGIMRLSAKTPSKNQDKENEDV